jgi:signal peptidase I
LTDVHVPARPAPDGDERPPEGDRASRSRTRSVVVELVLLVALAALIAVGLRTFVAQAFSIPSASMVPQLEVGDRVVVSKLAYDLHPPNRGDIVVFDCPPAVGCATAAEREPTLGRVLTGLLEGVGLRQPSTEEYIKRVVALPGETVEGHDGAVYVDGQRLVEPYLPPSVVSSDFDPVTLGEGELWVMGDNRANSSDSRIFGPIEIDTVVGRATLRVWPPTRTAFL